MARDNNWCFNQWLGESTVEERARFEYYRRTDHVDRVATWITEKQRLYQWFENRNIRPEIELSIRLGRNNGNARIDETHSR